MIRQFIFGLSTLALVSCQSPPPPAPVPSTVPFEEPAGSPPPPPVIIPPPVVDSGYFANLPGWVGADILPATEAFRRSCAKISEKAPTDPLSEKAWWAGTVADWTPVCAALDVVADEASARTVMQSLFVPIELNAPDGDSRFTGYFEPTYEARRYPVPPYTEPVPALPADLVPNGQNPKQRLRNGSTRPYPSRAEITAAGVDAIAYAHPSDVFFLQIQGSGRLRFPDGASLRAAYAAHNGHPFKSTANWLIRTGRIERGEASMQGIRAWMDRAGPKEARLAMNQNPRFVFFKALPNENPELGPNGAQNVPLTPLGSMAVDTSIHPLGVPMFVQTRAPGLGGDWSGLLIAQDTGGAIKGVVRGDIYFGTGPEAGERAGTMNAPGRLWVLLPRRVAERLRDIETADLPETLGSFAPAP